MCACATHFAYSSISVIANGIVTSSKKPRRARRKASNRAGGNPAGRRAQVIVVEDENGNIVRETMKDTDTLARYKTMHETLVYLSHLDHDDTEKQMLDKLRLQARCPLAATASVLRLPRCQSGGSATD